MASDSPPVELPHGWAFGRYELLGRLAYGGMAEIYLARESAYGLAVRYVVIKRVLPHIANDSEFVGLFMDEARVAMSLTHPHISHIYEFGRIEGSYFLAMEWVNGVALNKIIKRSLTCDRPLPMSVAVKAIAGVAEALDYAHSAKDEAGRPLGIIHRDVTPHNIMLTFDGSVKLLDFGSAMAASRSTDTRTGLVRGKLAYMSPQQCLAKAIDGRSDIFSLGVCLYEAVTGRRLFRRETDFEVCEAILKRPVPSIRDVDPTLPEELDAIVGRALAKDPDERFQRAGELQVALQRFLANRREVVSTSAMAQMLRELFPEHYRSGPELDTKTDLLNSLPRVRVGSGLQRVISSSPPSTQEEIPRGAEHEPGDEAEPRSEIHARPAQEVTGSDTHTVTAPLGRGMTYTFLVLLLAAVGLAGFAVWSLMNRPTPVLLAPFSGQARDSTAPPTTLAPVANVAAPAARAKDANEEGQKLKGSLWIASDPPGATIFLNGTPTGRTTPAQIEDVWPGAYRITLRMQGYETSRTRMKVEAGRVTQSLLDMMSDEEAREFYRRRARRADAEDSKEAAGEAHRGEDGENDVAQERTTVPGEEDEISPPVP